MSIARLKVGCTPMAKRATPRSSDSSSRIRCAIYTRKSTEEGLEQAFTASMRNGKPALHTC